MNGVTLSYFNPFSDKFHAWDDFRSEKLVTWQKAAVVAISLFAAVATFFIAFLGGVAAFRWLVVNYIAENEVNAEKSTASKVNTINKPLVEIKVVNDDLLSTNKRTNRDSKAVDPCLYKKFEEMQERSPDGQELKAYVASLKDEQLALLWETEKRAAGLYFSASDREKLKGRLIIELQALTADQIENSLYLEAFWNVMTGEKYVEAAGKALKAEHLSRIGKWLQEHFLAPANSPKIRALPEQQKGIDYIQYLKIVEDYFGQVVGRIPSDRDVDQEELIKKVEGLVSYATNMSQKGVLEKAVRQKINGVMTPEKRKELQQKHKSAAIQFRKRWGEMFAKQPKSAPTSPEKKLPDVGLGTRKRTNSEPPRQPVSIPKLEEPKLFQRKKTDEECRQILVKWKDHEKIEEDQEVLFWILDRVKEYPEGNFRKKMEIFIVDFLETIPVTGYPIFETMSLEQVATLVSKFESKSWLKLWEIENHAAAKYTEKREVERLKKRLSIELQALPLDDLKEALYLDTFWRLLSGLEYKVVAGAALKAEHFGEMMKWLQDLHFEPYDSPIIKKLHLKEIKELEQRIRDKESFLSYIIEQIPGDEVNEKKILAEKLEKICLYVTTSVEQVISNKVAQLTPADRGKIKPVFEKSLKTFQEKKREFVPAYSRI